MATHTTILLATNNPHKVEELTEILSPRGVTLRALRDAGADTLSEPVEDGDTFLANALIKARYYAERTGLMCLADDSGLEVDALAGEPGVRSARYAADEVGEDAWTALDRPERDARNNAKLLRALESTADERRTARFVCAMALVDPDQIGAAGSEAERFDNTGGSGNAGLVATARGTFEGRIAREPRGANGFGYDPLLILTDPADPLAGKHSAELTPDEKHARSHRGKAARAIAEHLRAHA